MGSMERNIFWLIGSPSNPGLPEQLKNVKIDKNVNCLEVVMCISRWRKVGFVSFLKDISPDTDKMISAVTFLQMESRGGISVIKAKRNVFFLRKTKQECPPYYTLKFKKCNAGSRGSGDSRVWPGHLTTWPPWPPWLPWPPWSPGPPWPIEPLW